MEIQAPPESVHDNGLPSAAIENPEDSSSAVAIYEQTVRDPRQAASGMQNGHARGPKVEVDTLDTQAFLAQQVEILEQLRADDERAQRRANKGAPEPTGANGQVHDSGSMDEQIGPVQTNVGGIQVDADDMLKKLKVRPAPISVLPRRGI